MYYPLIESDVALKVSALLGLYLLLRMAQKNVYLYVVIWWGSTILHEFAHWLLGYILGAKPSRIELIPRRDPASGALILGSVSFYNLRWWNKLPVATAPLLLLPLGYALFLKSLSYPLISPNTLLLDLAVLQCIHGFWPSRTDWRHARSAFYTLLSMAAIIISVYLMWINPSFHA